MAHQLEEPVTLTAESIRGVRDKLGDLDETIRPHLPLEGDNPAIY
jgi:hypothetical protein